MDHFHWNNYINSSNHVKIMQKIRKEAFQSATNKNQSLPLSNPHKNRTISTKNLTNRNYTKNYLKTCM